MTYSEQAVTFLCDDAWLHGIVSIPTSAYHKGVLIVVGGPQYRVGSHRQFTLLARDLATAGIPAFRFDYRGMGDSEGISRGFDAIHDDLHAAIAAFTQTAPSVREVVIWGLCDAASAAVFYAHHDVRVTGLILLNPWVRSQQGIAKTYLKQYYIRRLATQDFWLKILHGRFNILASGRSILNQVARAFFTAKNVKDNAGASDEHTTPERDLESRMYDGLARFKGRVLVILSQNDFTAQEFQQLSTSSKPWRKIIASRTITSHLLLGANHTFASRTWRDQVSIWTREWIRSE